MRLDPIVQEFSKDPLWLFGGHIQYHQLCRPSLPTLLQSSSMLAHTSLLLFISLLQSLNRIKIIYYQINPETNPANPETNTANP